MWDDQHTDEGFVEGGLEPDRPETELSLLPLRP